MSKKNNVTKPQREMTHRQLSQHQKAQRRQRIIFFGGIGIILAVVLIILGGWFAGEYMPLHAKILTIYDTSFDNQFFIDTLVIYGSSQGTTDLSSMASNILDQIKQNEIIRVAAEKLGITVSDDEAMQYATTTGLAINDALIELARGSLLASKLHDQYFGPQVPTSNVQLLVKAMLVESTTIAQLCKEQILNGANFTELVQQYALDTTSKDKSGDYGWHPIQIFKSNFGSTIPYDFLSGPDIKAGDISDNLSDNSSYKKMGYWLIRINERPDNASANVSAILLSSEELALSVRARIMAGEEIGPIADNLSQYNPSVSGHGELGVILASDNVTTVFNEYAFNQDIPLGEWSEPLKDAETYTRGGVWLIWVEDKNDNKPLSTEDLETLISNLYNDWVTEINNAATDFVVSGMTQDLLQFAINKATGIVESSPQQQQQQQ